jgi:hypothetical protein
MISRSCYLIGAKYILYHNKIQDVLQYRPSVSMVIEPFIYRTVHISRSASAAERKAVMHPFDIFRYKQEKNKHSSACIPDKWSGISGTYAHRTGWSRVNAVHLRCSLRDVLTEVFVVLLSSSRHVRICSTQEMWNQRNSRC